MSILVKGMRMPNGQKMMDRITALPSATCDDCIWHVCNYNKVDWDAPSAEAEWIPCSERLPDVDIEVLTTTDWSDVLIAWIGKGGAWETEEHILDNDEILAWMPLPEPYKGGDDE